MSDVLTGDPSHVTTPLAATVTGLTNNGSGAVRVATSAPHLFGDKDTVIPDLLLTALNTEWTIAVIDPTHFDLVGSTYTATSTGTVLDASLTPQVLVPTDGDPGSVQISGLLSAMQAVLDRTQFNNRKGLFSVISGAGLPSAVFTGPAAGPFTLVVPPGCFWMGYEMCGGGGGGEGGKRGEGIAASTHIFPQGGGGSGAPKVSGFFPVTPGETLTIAYGDGGAGGAAGGGAGADGGPAVIIGPGGPTDIRAAAVGGAGCGCGTENWSGNYIAALDVTIGDVYTDNFGAIAQGAIGVGNGGYPRPCPISLGPVAGQVGGVLGAPSGAHFLANYHEQIPQRGGSVGVVYLETSPLLNYGFHSFAGGDAENFGGLGGSAGTPGTSTVHPHFGGCAGGGGGAGAFGDQGGAGGNGGNASDGPGAGGNGIIGGVGHGPGAGGGGGGSGGDSTVGGGGGTAAPGGEGFYGIVKLYFLRSLT